MMLINIGGSRGGHFRHANVEMAFAYWKCSENGKNDMKSKKKKKVFWRSTSFDHLPPCGLGDYIHH